MSETARTDKELIDEIMDGEPKPERIDSRRRERAVVITHTDGKDYDYTIREMEGDDLDKWMKIQVKCLQADRRGRVLKADFRGFHDELIHLCLYDAQGGRVPKAMIQRWGSFTKNRLFAICQEINGLNDKVEEAEEKN